MHERKLDRKHTQSRTLVEFLLVLPILVVNYLASEGLDTSFIAATPTLTGFREWISES